jgi:hypothetical protein
MIKKFCCVFLCCLSSLIFAGDRNRPSNALQREFDKVEFFEFKRHFLNEITISYIMVEDHIYIFIRDQKRQTRTDLYIHYVVYNV